MTIDTRLAEIRARADAATEGPWEEMRRFGFAGVKGILCPHHVQVAELVDVRSDGDGVYRPRHLPMVEFMGTDADAEFIAASRTDLPALLAAVQDVMKRHRPDTVLAVTGDCALEDCDHEEIDDCVTVELVYCLACNELAEGVDPYYAERGMGPVAWPCPTVTRIQEALNGIA